MVVMSAANGTGWTVRLTPRTTANRYFLITLIEYSGTAQAQTQTQTKGKCRRSSFDREIFTFFIGNLPGKVGNEAPLC